LKISYLALATVPFVSQLLEERKPVLSLSDTRLIVSISVLYFANLALALANLIYDWQCPPVVKRFASPNDLYREMLEIASVQERVYPEDAWDGSLEHTRKAYEDARQSKCPARAACTVLFAVSLAGWFYTIADRSIAVVQFAAGAS